MKIENFFGSKLNTFLLLILIVLVAFLLKVVIKDKEIFLPDLSQNDMERIYQEEVAKLKSKLIGDTDNFVSFSIPPDSKVHGLTAFQGAMRGAYFFEANIRVNILDNNKKTLREGHATATTDWMTSGPVSYEGKIDFSGLPKGPAYIEIHNDNASDLGENDRFVLVPIVIE